MAISSTMTAGEAITKAYQVLGVVARGTSPSAGQIEEGLDTLNWMLKSWAADAAHAWRQETTTVTAAADDADLTLDPKPVDVYAARLQVSATYHRPMQQISLDDYLALPNKSQSGEPVLFALRKNVDSVEMLVWPVQSAEKTIEYDYTRVFEDITSTSDTLDIAQEWTEAVYYCLAAELLTSYTLHDIRPATAQRIEMRAGALKQRMLDHDRPCISVLA